MREEAILNMLEYHDLQSQVAIKVIESNYTGL